MTATIYANAKLEGFLVTNVGSAEAEEALGIVRELVEAEREACAQLCDAAFNDDKHGLDACDLADHLAGMIRLRSKP